MRMTMLAAALAATALATAAPAADWPAVESALGRGAAVQPDGVRRFGFPRTDLRVRVDGVELRPALALGGWLAFAEHGAATVTGDLVLLAPEIKSVEQALAAHGIEVTALYSHTLGEEPRLFYMHFWAVGPATAVAEGLRAALDRTNVRHVAAGGGHG